MHSMYTRNVFFFFDYTLKYRFLNYNRVVNVNCMGIAILYEANMTNLNIGNNKSRVDPA